MNRVRVLAPAKLNLGLEILGSRDDGYHEIRTVLAMVDLVDTVTVSPTCSGPISRESDLLCVPEADDLAVRALRELRALARISLSAHLRIHKHIPVSAGLGGASSDAAAALLAGQRAWSITASDVSLYQLAVALGTDVPFFLGGPCALARGTGTHLLPLPPLDAWAVIVTPPTSIPRKTATLYGLLRPSDMSDGERVDSVANAIQSGVIPETDAFANAFRAALERLVPETAEIGPSFRAAGAPFVALSGAGPSQYTIVADSEHANALASRLRQCLPENVFVTAAKMRDRGLVVETLPPTGV